MIDKLTHRNRQVFLIKWYIKLSLLINSIRSFGLFLVQTFSSVKKLD